MKKLSLILLGILFISNICAQKIVLHSESFSIMNDTISVNDTLSQKNFKKEFENLFTFIVDLDNSTIAQNDNHVVPFKSNIIYLETEDGEIIIKFDKYLLTLTLDKKTNDFKLWSNYNICYSGHYNIK